MITKIKIAEIKQLHQKKFRDESDLFLVEGTKSVLDLVNSNLATTELLATDQWLRLHESKLPKEISVLAVSEKEIERISCLKTPQEVLAVAVKPKYNLIDICDTEPILVLDDIRDPGNMG
ncbi:MAG: RNA methyltransferase, partial [Bacteroidales bacterium]